jgi:hypothetical protein
MISVQVFHEVRNALSSVVIMSETTSTLREDDTTPPQFLMSSIDDILDQIKEVSLLRRAQMPNSTHILWLNYCFNIL